MAESDGNYLVNALLGVARGEEFSPGSEFGREGAFAPADFIGAVLRAENTLCRETGSGGVIIAILDVLTRMKVQQFRTDLRLGKQIVKEESVRKETPAKLKSAATRFLRRALHGSISEEEFQDLANRDWLPLLEQQERAPTYEQWKKRRKELVYRDFGDRLSVRNPSRSTAFGEDILEPLWLAIRKEGNRRPAEDPLSDSAIAKLVHAIVISYFGPEVTGGVTADAIRKRVTKALDKKTLV